MNTNIYFDVNNDVYKFLCSKISQVKRNETKPQYGLFHSHLSQNNKMFFKNHLSLIKKH